MRSHLTNYFVDTGQRDEYIRRNIPENYLMPRKPSSQPTEVELQILNALWQRGPSSVRAIHDALAGERDVGYSTTLKMVQVMTEKGLLDKDSLTKPQVYTPAISQDQARSGLVNDLLQRAFGGAADKLVMHALRSTNISEQEIELIHAMLNKTEGSYE